MVASCASIEQLCSGMDYDGLRVEKLDGKVVVVGGQTSRQNFDSIEELDEISGKWKSSGTSLKTARNGHSLLSVPGTSEDFC